MIFIINFNKTMSWIDYYRLLEKYNGDLEKATEEEMDYAFRGNPNDPSSARALAEEKWKEKMANKRYDEK